MLPLGGFPLRKGAHDSEESDEKSHSGILDSKAACAYSRRYRGLPRPSSALKPSHPPDGVALFGPMVVSVWRLVKHIIYCVARRCCLPMHGVIVSFFVTTSLKSPFHPVAPHHFSGVELHSQF
jgi:hypothetical protein